MAAARSTRMTRGGPAPAGSAEVARLTHETNPGRTATGRARSRRVQRGILNSAYQGRPLMRLLLGTVAAAGSLALAIAAFAQSTPTPATDVPAQSNPSPAVPVPMGKRFACQTASQGLKGQERQDQVQLCVAQAHLDCLKQAIDQKIVGPPRKDFVRSCVQ
jgi:hypothetical protein